MKKIDRAEFFATVGAGNVHPTVRPETLKGRFCISDWRLQDGSQRIVGETVSDAHGVVPTEFYVAS